MIGHELLKIAAGLCLAAAFVSAQPKLRLGEVEDVAPARYQATLDLDPAKSSFNGAITIQAEVHKPVGTLWLNATKVRVKEASASAGGKSYKAAAVPGGDDFLGLKFDQTENEASFLVEREDALLPVESQLWNLLKGQAVTRALLGSDVQVFARKRFAAHPQLPLSIVVLTPKVWPYRWERPA